MASATLEIFPSLPSKSAKVLKTRVVTRSTSVSNTDITTFSFHFLDEDDFRRITELPRSPPRGTS